MLLRGILHEGVRAFVDEYLGSPKAPVLFGGRDEDLQRLHAFHRGSAAHAVLCAEAGRGKSALLLRFAWRLDQQGSAVAWLPVSLRFGTHRSSVLDALLTARLQALTGRTEHWRDLLTSHDALPALVLLDGLDELQDGGLLEALRRIPLAPGVKLLVSARKLVARDGTGWAGHLGWSDATVLGLDPLAYTGVAALTSAVGAGHLASEVMRRSGGDPLLVRLCAEAARHPLDEDQPQARGGVGGPGDQVL
jgi:hypothetical protein